VRPTAYDIAKRRASSDARLAWSLRSTAEDTHLRDYERLLMRRAATRIEKLSAAVLKRQGRGR